MSIIPDIAGYVNSLNGITSVSSNGQMTTGIPHVSAAGPQSTNLNHPVLGAETTTPNSMPSNTGTYNPASAAGQAFASLYDNEIGNLQNQYSALPDYQNADVNNVNLQYNPQLSALDTQHATGQANLQLAQQQLDTTKHQGLQALGNQLRGAMNGYQAQIGVMGAGNSSAAPLIGYALSQQGNRQMANMNDNYALQQTGLNQQTKDLEANYANQKASLDGWKQSQLNQIAENYARQQQSLQQAIMQAQGQKGAYLAQYGQTALANQTIAQMQALERQYADQAGQLHAQFQAAYAPAADISQYTGAPTINAITPDQLTPLSFNANQATPDNTSAYASLTKKADQNPNTANYGF